MVQVAFVWIDTPYLVAFVGVAVYGPRLLWRLHECFSPST